MFHYHLPNLELPEQLWGYYHRTPPAPWSYPVSEAGWATFVAEVIAGELADSHDGIATSVSGCLWGVASKYWLELPIVNHHANHVRGLLSIQPVRRLTAAKALAQVCEPATCGAPPTVYDMLDRGPALTLVLYGTRQINLTVVEASSDVESEIDAVVNACSLRGSHVAL